MAVRIGIDVGGTFTDAVILDNDTFELIGTVKVPTTHESEQGVAEGIVKALKKALEEYNISPEDVTFIAHGTTQATNALLEGDVEKVGIVGVGRGVEGYKVKLDTEIGKIELAPNKFLCTKHYFLTQDNNLQKNLNDYIADMISENMGVVVVSAAYSVDDPTSEIEVMDSIAEAGLLGTCSHEISKLYGLRIRTRTAVINASILPKMIQTANMTEKSVIDSNISAPLMIMRCDGGVMSVKEISKRPILTMLSGPAAGVAGALMSEKVSEGIFLEVGGTSTDISVIHNGQVMVNYAEVGGHKTYINSLDIRTVGIAGGSMIRVDGKTIEDVGPRSAHIANLPYILYTPPEELGELEIRLIQPVKGDFSNYCAIYDKTHDKLYALTLAGAANAAGYVEPDHYAFGYVESARRAFGVLAEYMGISLEDVLYQINHKAAKKNISVINRLIKDYNLDAGQIVLVGGGGGAAAVVPFLAEELKMPFKIAKQAEVISPIGVALAMVRDIVERTVINPTDEDIMMIRKEAELQAIKSGASPGTIEVFVEVDGKENKLRAIATGATELKTKNRLIGKVSDDKMLEIAKNSLKSEKVSEVKIAAKTDDYTVIQGMVYTKKLLGLLTEKKTPTRIINSEGVIRAQCPNGIVVTCKAGELLKVAEHYIGKATVYSEGGERLPRTYLLIGPRFVDLSKLISKEQILGLIKIELAGIPETEPVVAVFSTSVTSII